MNESNEENNENKYTFLSIINNTNSDNNYDTDIGCKPFQKVSHYCFIV
jgi:hypothetical protein